MNKLFAIVTAVFLYSAGTVRAEINIVDSLEWMSVDARLIVRGKVTRCEDTKGPGSVVYRDTTIEIAEVLKGKVEGKTVVVRLRLLADDKAGLEWKESGHSYLFFLTQGNPGDDKALANCLVPRTYGQGVIDLDKPQKVYTADMKKAEDDKSILAIVKKYAALPLPREVGAPNVFKSQRGFLRLEVPFDAPIHTELWGGSMVYMNVPAEEKYKLIALAKVRSKNQRERAVGADMLRNYPGKETVKALTGLLNDPAEMKWIAANGKLVKISYDVRRVAYDSLIDLGEKPAKPLFERVPAAGDSGEK